MNYECVHTDTGLSCSTKQNSKSFHPWPGSLAYPRFWKAINNKLMLYLLGVPGGSDGKESARSAGDLGSIPRPGRSHGERNGCCLCSEKDLLLLWQRLICRKSIQVSSEGEAMLNQPKWKECPECLKIELISMNLPTVAHRIYGVLFLTA